MGNSRALHSSLRRTISERLIGNDSNIRDISQLGITTIDKSGKLSFDTQKFLKVYEENPNDIKTFFNQKDTGFVDKINKKIDNYISNTGLIKNKNESFARTLKDINKQIESFNDRLRKKEEYYINMFSKLDTALMQAESQMQWLNNQLSMMNSIK